MTINITTRDTKRVQERQRKIFSPFRNFRVNLTAVYKLLATLSSDGGGCLTGVMTEGDWEEVAVARRGRLCLHIFDFYHKALQSWLP